MATVRALPYTVAIAAEHNGVLNILEQTAVALLMRLFDGAYHFKLFGYLVKALLACLLGKGGIHVGPLIVLAIGSIGQVVGCAGHCTAMQILEPYFSMLLLVARGLLKDVGHLYIAVLLGLRSIVLVLGVSLRFTGKGCLEVLFGAGSFKCFHINNISQVVKKESPALTAVAVPWHAVCGTREILKFQIGQHK